MKEKNTKSLSMQIKKKAYMRERYNLPKIAHKKKDHMRERYNMPENAERKNNILEVNTMSLKMQTE